MQNIFSAILMENSKSRGSEELAYSQGHDVIGNEEEEQMEV